MARATLTMSHRELSRAEWMQRVRERRATQAQAYAMQDPQAEWRDEAIALRPGL